jgi:hypothetical protein
MFVVAASARALLGLFGCSFAPTIAAMRLLRSSSFDDMYQQLRGVDFSRDLLHGNESKLRFARPGGVDRPMDGSSVRRAAVHSNRAT